MPLYTEYITGTLDMSKQNEYNKKYETKLKQVGIIRMTFFAHPDDQQKLRNTARLSRKRAMKEANQ